MTRWLKQARLVAALATALLFILLVPGCGELQKPGRTEVRFWCGFTGPDGRHILKIIKQFNQEHPEIHVTIQRIDWAQYYNKLFVAGLAQRAPEVFVIHSSSVERFWRAGLLRPLDDLATGSQPLDPADFSSNIWESVVREGRPVGIPLDVHMIGMYYNKNLFREAGIVDDQGEARPPKTREEFLDAARRLTRDRDGDGKVDQYGFVFTWLRTNALTVMDQWGGQYFNEATNRATMEHPANVEALTFLSDLVHKHKVAQLPYGDSFQAFLQGRVGIAFEGVYMLEEIKKQKDLEWAAAPVPVLGKEPAAWADSHVLCLKKEMDEEHTRAAWTFLKYLSDNSLDWAESGQVPVRTSLLNSDRFKAMTEQRILAEQIPYVRYVPQIPFVFEFLSALDTAAEQAIRGSKEPKAALTWASSEVNRSIERLEKRATRNGAPQP